MSIHREDMVSELKLIKLDKEGIQIQFERLPDHVIMHTFKHLPPVNYVSMAQVSKRMNSLVEKSWKYLTHVDFDELVKPIQENSLSSLYRVCIIEVYKFVLDHCWKRVRKISGLGGTFPSLVFQSTLLQEFFGDFRKLLPNGCPLLTHLELGANVTNSFSKVFPSLPCLEYLQWNDLDITEYREGLQFDQNLKLLKSLKRLKLCKPTLCCKLSLPPQVVQIHVHDLRLPEDLIFMDECFPFSILATPLNYLEKFHVEYVRWQDEELSRHNDMVFDLRKAIEMLPNLKWFTMSMLDPGTLTGMEYLQYMSLQHLDIRKCSPNDEDLEKYWKLPATLKDLGLDEMHKLANDLPQLERMCCKGLNELLDTIEAEEVNNDIEPSFPDQDYVDAFIHTPNLQRLVLNDFLFAPTTLQTIAHQLSGLKSFNISGCKVYWSDLVKFVQIMATHHKRMNVKKPVLQVECRKTKRTRIGICFIDNDGTYFDGINAEKLLELKAIMPRFKYISQ